VHRDPDPQLSCEQLRLRRPPQTPFLRLKPYISFRPADTSQPCGAQFNTLQAHGPNVTMNNDVEKGDVYDKHETNSPDYSSNGGGEPNYEETTEVQQGYGRRVCDSFKRDPNLTVTPKGVVGANGRVFNPGNAAIATAASPLARKLKGRHLQMIAIGGSIGKCNLWKCYGHALIRHRYWSLRCIWQSSRGWRSCFFIDLLRAHWYHAVLYGACAR
jgi:hypothetical protein